MRTKWLLYQNFLHMFDDVEKIMVDARVASRLPESVLMDKYSNVVDDVDAVLVLLTLDTELFVTAAPSLLL